MANDDRVASVTLRDLADDLDYWRKELEVTGAGGIARIQSGLKALVDVLNGYNRAGFRIDPE